MQQLSALQALRWLQKQWGGGSVRATVSLPGALQLTTGQGALMYHHPTPEEKNAQGNCPPILGPWVGRKTSSFFLPSKEFHVSAFQPLAAPVLHFIQVMEGKKTPKGRWHRCYLAQPLWWRKVPP